ncbi:GIY-YIG catalytic domain-containing protein [Colletotrichum tabaci]|uniref:GIY-YIG catalytic domain-containing protein n=1 Tax=Colletotrichum tabaci TaxID=1209068 RepID=A0AAV9T2F7_9PEZI
MPVQSKPIPALYTVYVLRSTVRHASLYIGSTPNPPRRLKQHNGEARGGAARTSRMSLRPWEMVGLVSGFPGMVAALKFEWALNNPHLSLHIPSASRITVSNGVKKNGHPRRPRMSLPSILSNLQLLLSVPSFRRWPLTLHFFAKDVYKAWLSSSADSTEPIPNTLGVVTDFGPDPTASSSDDAAWGIHALPLDYVPIKADCWRYAPTKPAKASAIFHAGVVICSATRRTNKPWFLFRVVAPSVRVMFGGSI